MSCLAILAVTAAMIIDGDTVRTPDANVRLTGENSAPFDTPEAWEPACTGEAKLGAQATGQVRALMPAKLCIIGRDAGRWLRSRPGWLYGHDGKDVRETLMGRGLAKASKNADWCR